MDGSMSDIWSLEEKKSQLVEVGMTEQTQFTKVENTTRPPTCAENPL